MRWTEALDSLAAPAVLVTVVEAQGSVPRKAGARMLVSADTVDDTIGGGHLELQAIDSARTMLSTGETLREERFPLGPRLGQCCGGVVRASFELLSPGDARLATLRAEAAAARAAWPRVMLCGAGHVGTALVKILATLPCQVDWLDVRDAQFPASVPANVTVECTDTPEAAIAAAPENTYFLVMTHSHALDQRLAEAILARPAADWFGLIGSATKRAAFERRLAEHGAPAERIAAMVCPIGLASIRGKEPELIAVSVAAQLLALWEQDKQDS